MAVAASIVVNIVARTEEFASGMQAAASRLEAVGKQMQDIGDAMTSSITDPLVRIGKFALDVGADFQASMNRVKAVTGATGDTFAALESQAKQLGRTTEFSATQAGDAMYFLASAGFDANQVMRAMPGVLQLASAAQMDLGMAADITSNILSGYAMQVEDLAHVNDVLVRTFQLSNVNLEQLGESFKYAGPLAAAAGIQFEETAAVIGFMGNAGIQASMAGTALRGAISALLQPTAFQNEALRNLGVATRDSSGDMLPLVDIIGQLEASGATASDMMQIFGMQAGPAMQAVVSQGSGALRDMIGQLKESGGTAEEVANVQMEGLKGAMKAFDAAMEGVGIAIGNAGLMTFFEGIVRRATVVIQKIAELNPNLLAVGVVVGSVAAAIGPLLVNVGRMIEGFSQVSQTVPVVIAKMTALGQTVQRTVVPAILRLNAALLANPIGLVVAALAALAAGFVYVYRHSETFRELFVGLVEPITRLANTIRQTLGGALNSLTETFGAVLQTISGAIGRFIEGAVNGLGRILPAGVRESMTAFHENLTGGVRSAVDTAKQIISELRAPSLDLGVDGTSSAARAALYDPISQASEQVAQIMTSSAEAGALATAAHYRELERGAEMGTLNREEVRQLIERQRELRDELESGTATLAERNEITAELNRTTAALDKVQRDLIPVTDRLAERQVELADVARPAITQLQQMAPIVQNANDVTRTNNDLLMEGARLQTLNNQEIDELIRRQQLYRDRLAETSLSLEERNDITKRLNDTTAALESVQGKTVNRMAQFKDFGMAQIQGVMSQFSPMGLAMELLGDVFKALQPAIDALKEPLKIVAAALGRALGPILEAFMPIVKTLAIAMTYAGQVVFTVVGALYKIIGAAVSGIGGLISKIPGLGGVGRGIQKVGETYSNLGKGFSAAAASMKTARDELRELGQDGPAGAQKEIADILEDSSEDQKKTAENTERIADALEEGALKPNVNVTVNVQGGGDPKAVAASVVEQIDRALGESTSRESRLAGMNMIE